MTKASRQTQASRLSMAMATPHVQFEGLCCDHRALMYSANGTSAQAGGAKTPHANPPVGIHHLDIWMEERPCIPPHNSPWGTFIVPVFIPPLMWLTRGPNQNIGFFFSVLKRSMLAPTKCKQCLHTVYSISPLPFTLLPLFLFFHNWTSEHDFLFVAPAGPKMCLQPSVLWLRGLPMRSAGHKSVLGCKTVPSAE